MDLFLQASIEAGPAAVNGGQAVAVRAAASLVAVAVTWFIGGWVPPRLARVAAVVAGVAGVAFVLAA